MNYKLAQELKDAGFPQLGSGKFLPDESFPYPQSGHDNHVNPERWVKGPTLEELIEACSKEFRYLIRDIDGQWRCWGVLRELQGRYSTPQEAIARLWITVNKE